MKKGRANGKYGRWQRAIRGEFKELCKRLDVAEDEAVAEERARLEAAIGAVAALIDMGWDVQEWRRLQPRAAEGLDVLRELVRNTEFVVEDSHNSHNSPTLAHPSRTSPKREGTVTGRIL